MVPYLANMGAAEAVFGGSDVCLQGRAGLVCDPNAHQSATQSAHLLRVLCTEKMTIAFFENRNLIID